MKQNSNTDSGQGNSYNDTIIDQVGTYCHNVQKIENNIYTSPSSPSDDKLTIKWHVSHNAVGVINLLKKARKHVVLHAAFYPKYAHDEMGAEIEERLKTNSDFTLTVIHTCTKKNSWLPEFVKILRRSFTVGKFKQELNGNLKHFRQLQANYPGQVEITSCSKLPLFPVVLVDNTIVVGHYAHSVTNAPCGLWLSIHHPLIAEVYDMVRQHKPIGGIFSSPEQLAILRYIEELALTEANLEDAISN